MWGVVYRDMSMTYLEKAEAEMRGMTLRIATFIFIPMMLLGVLLLRPHALFIMPSLLVDLLIGIIIILPIVALQTWRSRKA